MTRLELFNILEPIIKRVTGVPVVILADQTTANGSNVPAPIGEYASVEPKQSIGQRGQANIYRRNATLTNRSVDVEVRAQIRVEASVNFFRGNARDRAERLMMCNKRPDVSDELFRAKLGWFGTGAVNNLTALQSNNYEQRGQITLMLAYETRDELTINNIESASYEIQYENGAVVASGDVIDYAP